MMSKALSNEAGSIVGLLFMFWEAAVSIFRLGVWIGFVDFSGLVVHFSAFAVNFSGLVVNFSAFPVNFSELPFFSAFDLESSAFPIAFSAWPMKISDPPLFSMLGISANILNNQTDRLL